MSKEYDSLNIRQKMEVLSKELVEKEISFREGIREFEKVFLEEAAKKYNGNKTKMAKNLGMHRNTLHNLYRTLRIK